MSTIALTQLGSTLVWGMLADRFDIRKVSCMQFLIQGVGLITAISSGQIHITYLGFFLYGTGLAGSFVLRFAAGGAPFFGFLHDRTGSYNLSFTLFSCALVTSSVLILLATPPRRPSA